MEKNGKLKMQQSTNHMMIQILTERTSQRTRQNDEQHGHFHFLY